MTLANALLDAEDQISAADEKILQLKNLLLEACRRLEERKLMGLMAKDLQEWWEGNKK